MIRSKRVIIPLSAEEYKDVVMLYDNDIISESIPNYIRILLKREKERCNESKEKEKE